MAFSMSRFVLTPAIRVSSRALRALRTTSFHDDAVTMTLATRLSKSADTTAGRPLMRCVSTRMPLPEGNWKDVILPIDKDQSLRTFSAVMRSWIECAEGGTSGLPGATDRPHWVRGAPCASSNCALTMSVMEMDSVIVCSTCNRGLTSRK